MLRCVLLLSGRISSGKTKLAEALQRDFAARIFRTREFIQELSPRLPPQRENFQTYGDHLDRKTEGRWVADILTKKVSPLPDGSIVILDSVRIKPQVDAIRAAFGQRVVHLHLKAPSEILEQRYAVRPASERAEFSSYSDAGRNKTERNVDRLADFADVVIDTHRCTLGDVATRAASHLGLYGETFEQLVDVLVGGQYGSEGKGHIASYLAPEYDVLVRVGGPNAGHTIFEYPTNAKVHQLPSGTRRNETARLVLGPGAVLDEAQLLEEIAKFGVSANRLSIDPQAMIIGARDKKAEDGMRKAIASTARGVGAARARKIMGRDRPPKLAKDTKSLQPYLQETRVILERVYALGQRVFVEGTQGTGLSLHHGVYPFVTSGDTTASGLLGEVGIPPRRARKIIMVCRTYPIRVQDPTDGTSGPIGQEISWQEISGRSGIPLEELEGTEKTTTTGRRRRVAEFDWDLLRKATLLNAPTDIALTFVDYLSIRYRDARRFEQLDADALRFIHELERVAATPVSLMSTRFHYRSIIDRRAW